MTASATSSTKSKVTFLETVYPPISNQEAVWLQNDPEVEALLRQSDFYMIGGRAQAKFLNLVIDPETYVITFDFAIGDDFRDPVEIRIRDLPAIEERPQSPFGSRLATEISGSGTDRLANPARAFWSGSRPRS